MPINLADLSPSEEVAAVYLGYYDRAADPFGFSFWTQDAYTDILSVVQSEPEFAGATQVEQEEEVLARIAQDFSRQSETRAEYPFFTTPSEAGALGFLTEVYQNLFNRSIDTPGDEFWTPLLLDAVNNPSTADFSVGEIILEIIKGAQEPDKSVVENKIEVALDWTENAGADEIGVTSSDFVVQDVLTGQFDIIDQEAYDAARDVINGVDETQASVDAAKQETQDFIDEVNTPEPVEPTTLELDSEDIASAGTFEADTVILNLDENPPSGLTINAGEVIIRAQDESGPNPLLVDTSNWDVGKITVEDSEVDVLIDDIQGTDLAVEDQTDPTVTTEFNLDQQNAAGATQKTLGLNEVFGSVAITAENFGITGDGIETVDLEIEDPVGIESEVANLNVEGLETLNLSGGNDGSTFTITGPLDAGITTVDGSDAEADLDLNMSDSTEAITAIGGSGDDRYDMGNTLGSSSAQDILDGGAGEDTLVATFTSGGNRKPISESFEKFELDFQDNAQLDLDDVDDMHTIEITNVADNTGVEIVDADSTFTDLLITGETGGEEFGGDFGNIWEIGYDDITDDQFDQDDLTVTWQNNTGSTQYIEEFYIDRAEEVTFLFDGQQEMIIEDGFDLGANPGNEEGDEITENLVIRNLNDGDGSIFTQGGMEESDALETLTIKTTDAGDLFLDYTGPEKGIAQDFIDDAGNLEEISITASVNGDIYVGDIGAEEDANELRNINILSVGADIYVGDIDGDDDGNSDGATVSEVNISADDDAFIYIDEIDVEDIEMMTIVTEDDSVICIDDIDMDVQGGTLTVSGDGTLEPLNFQDEAFEDMDFSGLTENGVTVTFTSATVGSTVEGTDEDDVIEGGSGDDIMNGNDGDDELIGNDGDDILNGGAGDDDLFGGDGNDSLDGGADNDFLDGGLNDPSGPFGDFLTGGDGNDTFFFDLNTGGPFDDTGKSTNNANANQPGQDVITDFTPGGDTIEIDGNGTQDFSIAVFNGDGFGTLGDAEFFGSLGSGDVTKVVVRTGDYDVDNGTFNFNGAGADLQVLFDDDGGSFGDGYFNLAELSSGAQAFNVAEYEIGLLGAADQLGSLAASDFTFT